MLHSEIKVILYTKSIPLLKSVKSEKKCIKWKYVKPNKGIKLINAENKKNDIKI